MLENLIISVTAAAIIMLPTLLGAALAEGIVRAREKREIEARIERFRKAAKYVRDTREEDEARMVWVEPEETTTQENA